MRAGDASFHSGWTVHKALGNTADRMREVMTVIWFADGLPVLEPANSAQANDLASWLPGLAPGDLAASRPTTRSMPSPSVVHARAELTAPAQAGGGDVDREVAPHRRHLHADLLVEAERAGARVGRQLGALATVGAPGLEGIDEQGPRQPPTPLVLAHRELVDVGAAARDDDEGHADDRPLGVDDEAQLPVLVAGPVTTFDAHSSKVDRSRSDHSRNASSLTTQAARWSASPEAGRTAYPSGRGWGAMTAPAGSSSTHEVHSGR